jgi:uncharacterized protein
MTETTTTPAPLSASEERTWTMLAHLSGLLSFVGPLVVLLVFKDRSAAVAREAKESLNLQIAAAAAFTVLMIVGTILTFVVVGVVLVMIAPLVLLAAAILAVVGAVVAQRTGTYRYPVNVRLVK